MNPQVELATPPQLQLSAATRPSERSPDAGTVNSAETAQPSLARRSAGESPMSDNAQERETPTNEKGPSLRKEPSLLAATCTQLVLNAPEVMEALIGPDVHAAIKKHLENGGHRGATSRRGERTIDALLTSTAARDVVLLASMSAEDLVALSRDRDHLTEVLRPLVESLARTAQRVKDAGREARLEIVRQRLDRAAALAALGGGLWENCLWAAAVQVRDSQGHREVFEAAWVDFGCRFTVGSSLSEMAGLRMPASLSPGPLPWPEPFRDVRPPDRNEIASSVLRTRLYDPSWPFKVHPETTKNPTLIRLQAFAAERLGALLSSEDATELLRTTIKFAYGALNGLRLNHFANMTRTANGGAPGAPRKPEPDPGSVKFLIRPHKATTNPEDVADETPVLPIDRELTAGESKAEVEGTDPAGGAWFSALMDHASGDGQRLKELLGALEKYEPRCTLIAHTVSYFLRSFGGGGFRAPSFGERMIREGSITDFECLVMALVDKRMDRRQWVIIDSSDANRQLGRFLHSAGDDYFDGVDPFRVGVADAGKFLLHRFREANPLAAIEGDLP